MLANRFVVVAVAIVIASSFVSIMRRAVSRRFLDCLVDRSGLVDVRWFIGCLDLRSLLVGVLAWSWSLREDVLVDLLRARALIGKTVCLSVSEIYPKKESSKKKWFTKKSVNPKLEK